MPADSPHNTIARQWELLKILPSGSPGKSASDITQSLADRGYKVTKRTVERDLEALEALFPITHGDEIPYGWHWASGGAFGVMGLSVTDALSLHLLERFLRPILPAAATRQLEPVFELAARKLEAQADNNKLGRWAKQVAVVEPGLPVVPASIDAAAMQTVQEALLAQEKVEVSYARAGTKTPRKQILNPLGLVQCGAITYLVATAPRYTNPILYAMHRVGSARRLYERAIVPSGFSLQAFIDGGGLQFGETRPIRLKAWVSAMLGSQLAETKLSENQQLAPAEDGFTLTASLTYSWRLRWWILSKTGDIEVLAPSDLRKEIATLLGAAAERYRD